MFDEAELSQVLELHKKSYALLFWINESLRGGSLRFDVAHSAMSAADAAHEWLGRHLENLPLDCQPEKKQLLPFSMLFASYLTTSFDLATGPKTVMRTDCGCTCPYCRYFSAADNLKVRRPSKKDKVSALELKLICLAALLADQGQDDGPLHVERLLADPDLTLDISLVTYANELIRRSRFASQGTGVLVLWREIAWENDTPRKPGKKRKGSKKKFTLQKDLILAAEKRILQAILSS